MTECEQCGTCCMWSVIKISNLSQTSKDQLIAKGAKVFDKCVFIPNVCEHLGSDNLCQIHGNRPRYCRLMCCGDSEWYDELQLIKSGEV